MIFNHNFFQRLGGARTVMQLPFDMPKCPWPQPYRELVNSGGQP